MFGNKKELRRISDRLEKFIAHYNNDIAKKHNALVKTVELLDIKLERLKKDYITLHYDFVSRCTEEVVKEFAAKAKKKPAKKAVKKVTKKKGK